jgi:hypothetical protein
MIYDFRNGPSSYAAYEWACRAKRVFDADTGEEIRFVFYLNTETCQVGRYVKNVDGKFLMERDANGQPVIKTIWERRSLRVECKDGSQSVSFYGPPAEAADVPHMVG